MNRRQKMPYLVGTLLVIILVLGLAGNFSVNKVADLTSDLYEHPLTVSIAVLRVNSNVLVMELAMKDLVVSNSPEAAYQYRSIIDQTEDKVLADFSLIEERFLGDKEVALAARRSFIAWKPLRDEVVRLVLEGKGPEAAIITQTTGARQVEEIESKIGELRDFARNKAREFLATAKETRSRTLWFVWFSLGGSLILAGVIIRKAVRIEAYLQKFNEQLEMKVRQRTMELATANESLSAQNEEITAQNEEITAQNEEIMAMNEEINALNQNLEETNEGLELRVAERAAELKAAHEELILRYAGLSQVQESQRHNAEMQDVLREIAEAALLATSLDELFKTMHNLMKRVLPARNLYISLLDEAKGLIVRPYCVDEENLVPQQRPVGKGLTEYFMQMGQTVHITSELFTRLRETGEVDLYFAPVFECIGAPLRDSHGKIFGVITLYLTEEMQPFEAEDSKVLSIVAAQVSLAIERKQAEETLVESEARYRAVIEQAPEAVLLCDPDTGDVIEANSRFTERLGYDLRQDGPLTLFKLIVDAPEKIRECLNRGVKTGSVLLQRRLFMHRNGSIVSVERSATLVSYRGRRLFVMTIRDVSDEVRREQEIHRDAQMATRVQNAMLSMPEPSDYLELTTIYQPFGYVGGDLYFLDWRYGGSLLRGFLVDATGHGLGTALHTASLHVLLREVNERDMPLSDAMRWLNRRIGEYFDEGAFAGALGFEIDLQTRQLSWASAGIPKHWMFTQTQQGVVESPGMCLGIGDDETFDTHTMPLDVGDSLYFMTDGLSDLLGQRTDLPLDQYMEMVGVLRTLSESAERRDDATAVCIHVRSLPQSVVRRDGWPRIIRFNGYGDYNRLKGEVAKILTEVTGKQHSMHEVAVNEALANAMECRDGVPRQHKARLRFNKIGNLLIVRVKTSRMGFAGNAILRRLRSHPEEMFSFGQDAAMGRGVPIMLSISHRMMYNSDGTEVLLVWKL